MKLTVFFDGQFWVGQIERQLDGRLFSSLFTFGEEPDVNQIAAFVKEELYKIFEKQTESVNLKNVKTRKINPKRQKRMVSKELLTNPLSTKSQEAVKKQMEKDKEERKQISKEERIKHEEYKREKSVEKKKNKHRGR